jgi:type I restriction enzyme M protein
MSKRHRVGASQRSLVARIEELVLASSGADAFALVFSLVAARLAGRGKGRARIERRLDEAARRWPGLEPSRALDVPEGVLTEVEALLDAAALGDDAEVLDAVFEQLVTRVGKGEKGQFFTPRHVVDVATRALLLQRGERVLDPACGSGAFLVHARAQAKVDAWGFDVDGRALRVARLIAVATGGDPSRFVRADSLQRGADLPERVDVVVTNPPFAGAVAYAGYEVAQQGRRTERDALFLERCVDILRPGGRLAIVLPHNKVAASSWAQLRRWLVTKARVFAVISLPRETFMPHTAQKTALVLAKKRAGGAADPAERVFFAVSERAGKDAAGDPIARAGAPTDARVTWRDLDHDLGAIEAPLAAFLRAEGFAA